MENYEEQRCSQCGKPLDPKVGGVCVECEPIDISLTLSVEEKPKSLFPNKGEQSEKLSLDWLKNESPGELFEQFVRRKEQEKSKEWKFKWSHFIASLILVPLIFGLGLAWLAANRGSVSTNSDSERNNSSQYDGPYFEEPTKDGPFTLEPIKDADRYDFVPLPDNAEVVEYKHRRRVAPLTIRPKPGTGHYFVKLVDERSKETILTMFVLENREAKTLVPLGEYSIRYAMGKWWYGSENLFGSDTRYFAANKTFSFERTPGGYSGFTIELIPRVGGNLTTASIGKDEF